MRNEAQENAPVDSALSARTTLSEEFAADVSRFSVPPPDTTADRILPGLDLSARGQFPAISDNSNLCRAEPTERKSDGQAAAEKTTERLANRFGERLAPEDKSSLRSALTAVSTGDTAKLQDLGPLGRDEMSPAARTAFKQALESEGYRVVYDISLSHSIERTSSMTIVPPDSNRALKLTTQGSAEGPKHGKCSVSTSIDERTGERRFGAIDPSKDALGQVENRLSFNYRAREQALGLAEKVSKDGGFNADTLNSLDKLMQESGAASADKRVVKYMETALKESGLRFQERNCEYPFAGAHKFAVRKSDGTDANVYSIPDKQTIDSLAQAGQRGLVDSLIMTPAEKKQTVETMFQLAEANKLDMRDVAKAITQMSQANGKKVTAEITREGLKITSAGVSTTYQRSER